MKIKESGILNHIQHSYEEKYGGIARTCSSGVRSKGTPIDVHTVISALFIFIVGFILTILLMIVENGFKAWKYIKKNKEPMNRTDYSTIENGKITLQSVSTITLK